MPNQTVVPLFDRIRQNRVADAAPNRPSKSRQMKGKTILISDPESAPDQAQQSTSGGPSSRASFPRNSSARMSELDTSRTLQSANNVSGAGRQDARKGRLRRCFRPPVQMIKNQASLSARPRCTPPCPTPCRTTSTHAQSSEIAKARDQRRRSVHLAPGKRAGKGQTKPPIRTTAKDPFSPATAYNVPIDADDLSYSDQGALPNPHTGHRPDGAKRHRYYGNSTRHDPQSVSNAKRDAPMGIQQWSLCRAGCLPPQRQTRRNYDAAPRALKADDPAIAKLEHPRATSQQLNQEAP